MHAITKTMLLMSLVSKHRPPRFAPPVAPRKEPPVRKFGTFLFEPDEVPATLVRHCPVAYPAVTTPTTPAAMTVRPMKT